MSGLGMRAGDLRGLILAAVVGTLVAGGPAEADFAAGWAAYEAGDYETALTEFLPLAEAGDAGAQTSLGQMYHLGDGVARDQAEAARWYRTAAEQGNAEAQYHLGFLHYHGEGVAQNYSEAVRWYRLAAERGYASAQNNLGLMYDKGEGVLQNDVLTHTWFTIAGANGDGGARENRDRIAERMTPQDISVAQERARVCMESGYQACE